MRDGRRLVWFVQFVLEHFDSDGIFTRYITWLENKQSPSSENFDNIILNGTLREREMKK